MVSKKGDQKYYIIISLILGLVILTISLYWIFGEFFDEDELDWEVCRQSIILRAGLPEKDLVGLKLDVKGAFPLKCKTEVVTIDNLRDPEEVYKKIADAVASGWYMFGEGKLDFVHRDATASQTVCMAFARIHISEEAYRDFDIKRDASAWSKYPFDFGRGFSFYYGFEKFENSGGTYNDYLSIYEGGDVSKEGNLVIYWDGLMTPPYAIPRDYFIVYVINKRAGAFTGKIFKSKAWEDKKVLALISVDDLDVLGCTKFLTVPA